MSERTGNIPDPYKILRRYRRKTLSLIRLLRLAVTRKLIRIPIKYIANEYAFSMADDGWNYFRALLAEYEHNPCIQLEDTTFFHFFQDDRVKSVKYLEDLIYLHDPKRRSQNNDFRFYFGTYPWGHWKRSASLVGGIPYGYHHDQVEGKMTRDLWGYRRNPWYRPGDKFPLEIEWKQLISLFHSIRRGYHPLWYGSFPEVTVLVRHDDQKRAIRYNGQHRLSILSHLGYAKVTVAIPPESLEVIHEAEVDQWYYVKHGYCTPKRAIEIFNAFFILNGRERIEYLGLPSIY